MMKVEVRLALLALLCVWGVVGDIYLHNPRGSNNRLNEADDDVDDEERLFDSQNNAKGGYGWGPAMTYVEGSILPIQWTNQHACGQDGVSCNLVIQYMCTDTLLDGSNVLRDGTTTTEISAGTVATKNADGTYTYGQQEDLAYYTTSAARERNKGLFTADQQLNGNTAQYTRQNPTGTRYGFESAEERDYYPYWAPTPWKDIAVLANSDDDCAFYQANSQNVVGKGACVNTTAKPVPNNPTGCATAKGTWITQAAFNLPPPNCTVAPESRDNHLGNTAIEGGEMANYTWILPTADVESCISTNSCACAVRIRYNISTAESAGLTGQFIDAKNNSLLKANSNVQAANGTLTLAFHTDQTGRTFQDRSFMFQIMPRPDDIAVDAKIYNLNVRGKRGNIVQVYPAVEYDYVPSKLTVEQGDYIHFQWTGSNTNPQNNEGEGTDGTDRSNIVQTASANSNYPIDATKIGETVPAPLFESASLRHYMAFLGQTNCPNPNTLNNPDQNTANCANLNAAKAYFNGGIIPMNTTGTFYYMGSRNNNFSNRTQKGKLVVITPGSGTSSEAADKGQDSSSKVSTGAIAGIAIGGAAAVGAVGGIGALMYSKKSRRTLTPNTA